MSDRIFIEENGIYQIDCTAAVWTTNKINDEYKSTSSFLSDVDFVACSDKFTYLIEYKNANISGAVNPEGFKPFEDRLINSITKKFYDSLHYLKLNKISKPVKYVYIVEYPKAGKTDRKLLRERIAAKLPFKLQHNKIVKIIYDFDVVSIDEWNQHMSKPVSSTSKPDESISASKSDKISSSHSDSSLSLLSTSKYASAAAPDNGSIIHGTSDKPAFSAALQRA